MTDFEHCTHCPGPDDPRHEDPEFAKAEAGCAFYENPDNLAPAAPGRKPVRPAARSSMTSIRFAPEDIEAVKTIALEEGITVSSWIRRLVSREIKTPEVSEFDCGGVPLRIPCEVVRSVAAAVTPALMRYGSVRFDITGDPTAKLGLNSAGEPVSMTTYTHITVSPGKALAGAEHPRGIIPDSARRGEPKALPSSLSLLPGRTFSCPHLSVGNVISTSCEICGPLQSMA